MARRPRRRAWPEVARGRIDVNRLQPLGLSCLARLDKHLTTPTCVKQRRRLTRRSRPYPLRPRNVLTTSTLRRGVSVPRAWLHTRRPMTTTRDPLTPYITGWELVIAARRFQHRMEVAMDQALEGFAITFAQYRALEAIRHPTHAHLGARPQAPTHPPGHPGGHQEARARRLPARRGPRVRQDRAHHAAWPPAPAPPPRFRLPHPHGTRGGPRLRRASRAARTAAQSRPRPRTPRRPTWWLDAPPSVPEWLRELERADANPPPAAPTTGG